MNSLHRHPEKLLVSFLSKTLTILENPLYQSIIAWDPSGRMIQIKNQAAFEQDILSKQFKHKNIKSFVRQLNMYGFRKAKKGVAKNSFYHPYFRRDSKQNIKMIRRRKNCRAMSQQNFPPIQIKIQSNSKKSMGSEDTIIQNNTPNQYLLFPNPSVVDIKVPQQCHQNIDINPWNYSHQQDIFHYEDSFEYQLLPSN